MSIIITKTKKESTQVLSNKFPRGVRIFDVYASESKEAFPEVSLLTDKFQQVYRLGIINYFPNFLVAPKNENVALRVKFGGKETRPVLGIESDNLVAIGLIHEHQLEKYGDEFFRKLFSHFDDGNSIKITCFVNKFNKWTMNPYIGEMFENSELIQSYTNQEVTAKTAYLSAF